MRGLLRDREVRLHYQAEKARTSIAQAVKALRLRAGLTQAQLAGKIQSSQSVVARLEGGSDTRMPSLPLLGSIARACGALLEFAFRFKDAGLPGAVPARAAVPRGA
jgi:transcriptional regulator with XRE-family HTH domain